jgi:hypothetical protein
MKAREPRAGKAACARLRTPRDLFQALLGLVGLARLVDGAGRHVVARVDFLSKIRAA